MRTFRILPLLQEFKGGGGASPLGKTLYLPEGQTLICGQWSRRPRRAQESRAALRLLWSVCLVTVVASSASDASVYRHRAPLDFLQGYLEGRVDFDESGYLELGSAPTTENPVYSAGIAQRRWNSPSKDITVSKSAMPSAVAWNGKYWALPARSGVGFEIYYGDKIQMSLAGKLFEGDLVDIEWYDGHLYVLMKPKGSRATSVHLYQMASAPDGSLSPPKLAALSPPGVVAGQIARVGKRLFITGREVGYDHIRLYELRSLESGRPGWASFGEFPLQEGWEWDLLGVGASLVGFAPDYSIAQVTRVPRTGRTPDWKRVTLAPGNWEQEFSKLLHRLGQWTDSPGVAVNQFRMPEEVQLNSLRFLIEGDAEPRVRFRLTKAGSLPYGDWTPYREGYRIPIDRPGRYLQYQVEQPVNGDPVRIREVRLEFDIAASRGGELKFLGGRINDVTGETSTSTHYGPSWRKSSFNSIEPAPSGQKTGNLMLATLSGSAATSQERLESGEAAQQRTPKYPERSAKENSDATLASSNSYRGEKRTVDDEPSDKASHQDPENTTKSTSAKSYRGKKQTANDAPESDHDGGDQDSNQNSQGRSERGNQHKSESDPSLPSGPLTGNGMRDSENRQKNKPGFSLGEGQPNSTGTSGRGTDGQSDSESNPAPDNGNPDMDAQSSTSHNPDGEGNEGVTAGTKKKSPAQMGHDALEDSQPSVSDRILRGDLVRNGTEKILGRLTSGTAIGAENPFPSLSKDNASVLTGYAPKEKYDQSKPVGQTKKVSSVLPFVILGVLAALIFVAALMRRKRGAESSRTSKPPPLLAQRACRGTESFETETDIPMAGFVGSDPSLPERPLNLPSPPIHASGNRVRKIEWRVADPLPQPMAPAAAFSRHGAVYVVDPHGTICSARLRADGSLCPWGVQIGRLPASHSGGAVTLLDDFAVCFADGFIHTARLVGETIQDWKGPFEIQGFSHQTLIAGMGNRLFLVGRNGEGRKVPAVRSVDLDGTGAPGHLRNHPPLAAPIREGTLAAFQDRLYWFGGKTPEGLTNRVFSAAMDTQKNLSDWEPEPNLPDQLSRPSVIEYGNQLWLMGGKPGSKRNTVFVSTLNRKRRLMAWEAVDSDLPEPITGGAMARAGKRFLLLGGWKASKMGSPVSEVYWWQPA